MRRLRRLHRIQSKDEFWRSLRFINGKTERASDVMPVIAPAPGSDRKRDRLYGLWEGDFSTFPEGYLTGRDLRIMRRRELHPVQLIALVDPSLAPTAGPTGP
jgi:hypothetical protein